MFRHLQLHLHFRRISNVCVYVIIVDKSYMALAMLNGVMAAISVHYRAPSVRSGSTSPDEPDSPVNIAVTPTKFFDSRSSLTPLAVMSTARCAFGLEVLDGQLVACG